MPRNRQPGEPGYACAGHCRLSRSSEPSGLTLPISAESPVRSHAATFPLDRSRQADRRIFLALQPSDPHVSLRTLAVEKRGCDRRCSGEERQALLSVIEVNVFVDQVTRSTSQILDPDNYQRRTSDLPILRAAYRNRTDDLRITRSSARCPGTR